MRIIGYVYGGGGGYDAQFEALAATPDGRARLVDWLVRVAVGENADGLPSAVFDCVDFTNRMAYEGS